MGWCYVCDRLYVLTEALKMTSLMFVAPKHKKTGKIKKKRRQLRCSDLSPDALTTPMLAQIILSLVVFAAQLARERDLRTLVRALVDHQVVRFGEAALAELADELALWSHLTTKVRPTIVVINSHHRKHCCM